jgi:hypothetical protein
MVAMITIKKTQKHKNDDKKHLDRSSVAILILQDRAY